MDLVIRISREDLLAALKGGESIAATATAIAPSTEKAAKAEKPAKAAKAEKPAKKPAPAPKEEEEEEFDESETEEEEEEEEEAEAEEEQSDDEDEFVTGDDLARLKKALNAHKAANGGKPKKTLEILRKFAPGGSEKVKPDVLPKLLKALKV